MLYYNYVNRFYHGAAQNKEQIQFHIENKVKINKYNKY